MIWETIELRELRVFITLAEELHFSNTAMKLGLTPSRVSQSVRALESKLGGQLVHRTSRRVTLTPLGTRFLEEAGGRYRELLAVLERTCQDNQTLAGVLRLGLLSPSSAGPHLLEIIDAFEARHPACSVHVSEVAWPDALEPLRRGEVELMAIRLPLLRKDIVVGPTLSREPRVLAVAHDHPLGRRTHVSVEDIADYPVASIPDLPKEIMDAFVPHTTPAGRPIGRVREHPRSPVELTTLIVRGHVVHPCVPSFSEYMGRPGIVYVPIVDMPPSETGLVWARGRTSDLKLREFVRIARDVLGRYPDTTPVLPLPPVRAA